MGDTIYDLDKEIGPLASAIGKWAEQVLRPYLLAHPGNQHSEFKIVHDPIGKAIRLEPWEVYVVDSPIFQRLRGIRQLGVGHFLFPTSGYSRFEHSLGCVQTASLIFDAVSTPSLGYEGKEIEARRDMLRLAALLHDVGHSIMSHVSERFYAQNTDVMRAQKALTRHYRHRVSAAEAISILILRSAAFQELLVAAQMRRTIYKERDVVTKICACIAGSKHRMMPDVYLAEIVNGDLDCDKLDYIARDAHMAGVPISLDIEHLCSKLRIGKSVTSQNSPILHMAVTPSGARALEEMLVSRIFLYDKFYYHQKIMASEELVRRSLFYLARAYPAFSSPATLLDFSDDEFLALSPKWIASQFGIDGSNDDLARGCQLLARARARDLPKRAFAFARRFIPEMPEAYSRFVNAGKGDGVPQAVGEFMATDQLLSSPNGIDTCASGITALLDELASKQEVFIGYQSSERAAGKMDMPVFMPGGETEATPDFMFNVSKWSDAYKLQKQTSYVFAYNELPQVHLAAERWFAERRMSFAPKCWIWSKMSGATIRAARLALPAKPGWLSHKLPPNYLEEQIAKDRINKLRAKFATFLHSIDPTVGPALIESWVWQFGDPDLQDSALALLEYIKFAERPDIISGFKELVSQRVALAKAVWVPLRSRSGPGASADQIRYDLKDLALNVVDIGSLDAKTVWESGRVVFFDDVLNTGVQSECLLNSWFVDDGGSCLSPGDRDPRGGLSGEVRLAITSVPIDFAFYAAHPKGEARLRGVADALGLSLESISAKARLDLAEYSLAGFRAAGNVSREHFLDFLQRKGEELLTEKYSGNATFPVDQIKSYALGFGGLETVLLTRHSVSTAMPVALWLMSRDTVNPWLPLFPRKPEALAEILVPVRPAAAIETDEIQEYVEFDEPTVDSAP